jgi:Cu/Ag efflux pump CusA
VARQLLSVQVHEASKERLTKLVEAISQQTGNQVNLSDVARMALARGTVALEAEYNNTPRRK